MSSVSTTAKPSLLWNAWWLLPLSLLLWFKELNWMGRTAMPSLDSSWHFVKGVELLRGTQLGVDSVYTYGRLGWFYAGCYIEELWNWQLWGFEVLFKGLLVLFCIRAVWLTPGWLARVLFAIALLLVPVGLDGFAFIASLALMRYLMEADREGWFGELLALALWVVLAMIKFTYALVFFLGIGVLALVLWRAVSARRAALFFGRALLVFLGTWFLFGQSLLHLPDYLLTSWWVTQGYNDGMSIDGPNSELILAWMLIFSTAGMVVALAWNQRRDPRVLGMSVLAMLTMGLAYKAGFTRHMGNAMILFAVAPTVSFFVLSPAQVLPRLWRWGLTLTRALTIGACLLGFLHTIRLYHEGPLFYYYSMREQFQKRWEVLADVQAYKDKLQLYDQRTRAYFQLPEIRKRVGQETVDVFDCGQAIAMLNELNYTPRPVFQSFKAYMPELLELNRRFYESERAPRFILYQMEAIDQRLPLCAENDTMEVILRRYQPVLVEKQWLLLERRDTSLPAWNEQLALETEASFGEWVELGSLPGEGLRLSVDLQPTLRGKLWSFLIHGALVWGEFELDNGTRLNYRVVPRSLRHGVLVRPHLGAQDNVVTLWCGEAPQGVKRFRIVATPQYLPHFEPRFAVRATSLEHIVPPREEKLIRALRHPSFFPPPDGLDAAHPPASLMYRGQEVSMLHAPSSVRWELEAGRYRLKANYGLLEAAWKEGCTDGATFSVLLRSEGRQVRELLSHNVDPSQRAEDKAIQSLELEFEAPSGAALVLRATPGPADNSACDWTFWSNVRLEKVP